jgi:hypothetical protein
MFGGDRDALDLGAFVRLRLLGPVGRAVGSFAAER